MKAFSPGSYYKKNKAKGRKWFLGKKIHDKNRIKPDLIYTFKSSYFEKKN